MLTAVDSLQNKEESKELPPDISWRAAPFLLYRKYRFALKREIAIPIEQKAHFVLTGDMLNVDGLHWEGGKISGWQK